MKKIIILFFIFVGLLNAQIDNDIILDNCKDCMKNYDECLSDLFQGLGSMDGDDIKNCQINRDECLELIKNKIKG